MNPLGENNFAIFLNGRTVANLATSMDLLFQPGITSAIAAQEAATAIPFGGPILASWLDMGLEDPLEQKANIAMPFPRLLYATTDSSFSPVPAGAGPAGTLIERLKRYDAIASGPVVATIPKCAPGVGNPCEINFTAHNENGQGQRITFLRNFYSAGSPPEIEIVPNGLVVTMRGQAYRGDLFSRRLAQNSPTHSFEMRLRYRLRSTGTSDVNLAPVPFRMVTDPPTGSPPLPANGRPVFAASSGGKFYIPAEDKEITDGIFNGVIGDVIFESAEDAEPRYRVEPRSDDEPNRFVIREIGSDTILAEAMGGRLYLEFVEMVDIQLIPFGGSTGVSASAREAIGQSLAKVQPTLAQTILCSLGSPSSPVTLNQLELVGPTGLDVPLMTRTIYTADCAEIVTQVMVNTGDPGPVGSIRSVTTEATLSRVAYFPETQAMALSDVDPIEADLSEGAHLSVAVGGSTLQPTLDKTAAKVKEQVLDLDAKFGLDQNSVSVNGAVVPGAFRIRVSGEGKIDTPWYLPDYRYTFSADVKARFRAVRAIARGRDGTVRDRFNCRIPPNVLSDLGLKPDENQVITEVSSMNPISFYGYADPADGVACFNCPLPVRVAPPVYDADGFEIPIPDPQNPPEICPDQVIPREGLEPLKDPQKKDDPFRFGQAMFDDPAMRYQWELSSVPPTKDDVDVDLKIKPWALLLTMLLASFVAAILAPFLWAFGAFGIITVGAGVLTSAWLLLPFTNLIAGAIAGKSVRKILEQNPQTFDADFNSSAFLGLYLEEPGSAPEPIDLEEGALITRFRVVIQAAGLTSGGPC